MISDKQDTKASKPPLTGTPRKNVEDNFECHFKLFFIK